LVSVDGAGKRVVEEERKERERKPDRSGDVLLLEFKGPVGFGHGFQYGRVGVQELVVDSPETSDVLRAAGGGCAAVIADMQGEDVAGESVAVKVQGRGEFGAGKA